MKMFFRESGKISQFLDATFVSWWLTSFLSTAKMTVAVVNSDFVPSDMRYGIDYASQ